MAHSQSESLDFGTILPSDPAVDAKRIRGSVRFGGSRPEAADGDDADPSPPAGSGAAFTDPGPSAPPSSSRSLRPSRDQVNPLVTAATASLRARKHGSSGVYAKTKTKK
ncbi:unnamed protein product [Tetraodon nigroviridis]|uniref:(spotted green pufferfish) hypothetical protein n=1 Tax=Tetraodon nigroviridis TaxID=99883 RepID=Q4S9S6_TETNG|nr:unnamed protein product [Tetraodon nigroviridis]